MRKIICFAAALLPVLLLPSAAWAQVVQIANYSQLKEFASTVNNGNTTLNAVLAADIICADATWIPIGNETNAYTGTFDGQGHRITGLNNTSNAVSNYAGLFGHLGSGGVVKNLTLSGATITGKENVGGIVGKNAGGTVTNCRVEGNVTIRAGAAYAKYLGGIVGWNTSGTISGCISAAAVSNNNLNNCTYFGGIVGYFLAGTLQHCLYTGTTVTAKNRFGAIVGTFGSGGGSMNNNYYTTIELGGNGSENSGSSDMSGCRRAYTVTLGANVGIKGSQTSYSHSGLTAYVDNTNQSKYALSYTEGNTTTYYSGENQKLVLTYAGSGYAPTGYHRAYSYNDGSDHEVDGNTLTMPAANIYVTCTGDVPNTYKVVFKSNGGSGSMADQAFTYDVAQNLTSNAFNRSGYIYSGWNTKSDGSGTAYSDGQNVSNLTTSNNGTVYLYAQWTPDFATHWHADADHDGTTEERAYIITTPEGLELLASEVRGGNNFSGKFFALGSDIAYEHSSNWNAGGNTENNHLPIGSDNNKFYGIFDGRGHTIRGVRVNNNSSYSGLFGYIDGGAVVKNITLTDSRVRGADHAGGISGSVGIGSVENCHVTSTVAVYAVADDSDELGGIAGTNWGAINGCTSSATVTSRNLSACNSYGGIAGSNGGTIMNCLALNATVSASTSRGGVAGDNSDGNIINSFFRSCKIEANYLSNGFSINAGANVTLAPAGDATQSFPYGGLQAYSNVLLHDGTYYATGDNDVSLTLNYSGSGTPISYLATEGSISGSANSFTLTMPWSDVTVEAVFPETVVYTVHFDANGGNGTMADLPFTYGKEQALPSCAFHRSGYVFTGWNTAVYGNGTAYDNQQSVSNITSCFGATVTLYAQWSPDIATLWHADADHDGKTAERAYIITTAEGLQLLSSMSFEGNHFAGTFFKLGADIDMGEAGEFIPIGYLWDFRGHFDGDNHRIKGLYVNLPDDEGSGVGLFGNAYSGTIKNITLFGARIIGNYDVGGIVGHVEGCTVSNCHVIGSTIYATLSDFPYVGAIVGFTDYIDTLAGNTYHSTLVYAPNYASELFQLFHSGGDAFNIGVGYSENEHSHSQIFCGDFTAASLDATQLTLPEDSGQRAAILAAYQNPGAHTAYNGTPPNVSGLFGNLGASPATIFGEAKYVTTFYNGTIDYLLSPGAKAYTASISGTTVLFHQIGDDGSVIPHGTAAIIVSESASIPLTQLVSTNVTAHAGSVLRGSDVNVEVTAGKVNGMTPYVLGISGTTLGFYKFNGSTIPAGKAFYLKSE